MNPTSASGFLAAETQAQIQRVSGRVMNALQHDPVWSDSASKIAVFTDVKTNVASMVQAGVTSDKGLFEAAMTRVVLIRARQSEQRPNPDQPRP